MVTLKTAKQLAFVFLVVAGVAGAHTSRLNAQGNYSGGFFCGYGDCTFLYDCNDDPQFQYNDEGGGLCDITLGNTSACCSIQLDCSGSMFGWHGLENYYWSLLIIPGE